MNEQQAAAEFDRGNQLLQDGKLENAIAAYYCAIELNPANSWFYHHLGEALATQGRFDEAVTAFCSAIELKPDFAWSYHHMGDALARQQKWEAAVEAFRQAIELNPQHFGSYCGLGRCLEQLGLVDGAIAAYDSASKLNPDADWIHQTLANALQQRIQSDLAEAIASYRQIVELNPDNTQAYHNLLQLQPDNWELWLQLARALTRQKQIESAIHAYRRTIELQPNFSDTYLALGDALISVEQWQEGLASYRRALELCPDDGAVYFRVWAALAPLKKWEAAATWYRQALELNPNAALAYHHLGAALAGLKQTEPAVASYRRAIDLNPNFSGTYLALGDALISSEQLEEGLASYRRAFELAPNDSTVHFQVWTALSPLKKWETAASWYSQALELNPNAGWAHHHLGAALAFLKQATAAVASYRRAAELNPNSAGTYWALAETLVAAGRWDEALAAYYQFLELSPNSNTVYFQVWTVLAPLQKWEQAATWYRQALEIYPYAAWAYHHLGASLANLKQWEAATASYRRATELNPDFLATHLLLGDALAAVGRWDEVILYTRQALDRHSDSLELHLRIGVALASLEQWEAALACYRQALELTLTCERQALEIQQDRVPAYSQLTIILIQQGLLDEAISSHHQVFDRHPSRAGIYLRLTTILAQQGLMDEALVCFWDTPQRQPAVGEVCEYIWKGLHQLSPLDETSLYCQTEIQQKAVEEYFIENSQYRVMAINSLAESDHLFLEQAGFSIAHLELMCRDDLNLEELYINSFDRDRQSHLARKVEKKVWEIFGHPDVVQSLNFQQTIVETGYIYSICPFSGTVVRSDLSFNYGDTTLIYRFFSANIFYLIVGGWGGSKRSLYFPHLELILNFRAQDWWAAQTSQNIVNTFKSYAILSWLPFKSYINDQQKKETVSLSGFVTNIGHYFWNDMSGIQNLYENDILHKIDKFLVGPYEYFSVAHIFPEIAAEKFIHTAETGITLFQSLLSSNYFCVRATDLVIKEQLANRVHQAAIKRCSPAFLQEVDRAKQHFPLLWVGYRNRNRVWISQVEGMANIIKSLHSQFPNLGVVFGGWSPKESEEATPWEADWLEAPMKNFVGQLLELIPPSIQTYNAFGIPTYEKNVLEYAADLYIATVGSDTIYVATLGNKPGVIHSNSGLWHTVEPLFLGIRENCVLPTVIAKEHIVENEDSNHMVRNYDCDWHIIYDEVIKIVESQARLS